MCKGGKNIMEIYSIIGMVLVMAIPVTEYITSRVFRDKYRIKLVLCAEIAVIFIFGILPSL